MRLIFDKGMCAVAENVKDVQVLMSLESSRATKRRRKQGYRKECVDCGKSYTGLGVHMAKMHKVSSG